MIIGIPRERKILEKRVALIPQGAKELIQLGHTVLIENGAGAGSGFSNDQFKDAGCKIVDSLADVWGKAQLLVKVKEPDSSEVEFFRQDLILFDYLHLASLPELAKPMLKSGLTSLAYELVQLESGRLPLLEPMSEIAGKLSIVNGAHWLLAQSGGAGVLLSSVSNLERAKVTVIGAGIAGKAAARLALGMGAEVVLLDRTSARLEIATREIGSSLRTELSEEAILRKELPNTDLLVGAVLIPGAAAPRVFSRELLRLMKKKSVFVDISIDQGGCSETSRATTLEAPIYEEEGIIHYCVCNMPAQVPRTSTLALTKATLPYIIEIASSSSLDNCLKNNAALAKSLVTSKGKILNKAVADSL